MLGPKRASTKKEEGEGENDENKVVVTTIAKSNTERKFCIRRCDF